MVKSRFIRNDTGKLNKSPAAGKIRPKSRKIKPDSVIKDARGTIRILAKTVTTEIILKFKAIIKKVPAHAESETRKPSHINLNSLGLRFSRSTKDFSFGKR